MYKSDIEIAQECKMKHITEIAKTAHVDEKYIGQAHALGFFHSYHHGFPAPLHGDQQHIRICLATSV